jgi:hypothetical protein
VTSHKHASRKVGGYDKVERVVAMTKMKGMVGDSYLQKLPRD